MPMFAYTARDMSGKQVTGTVEANAEREVAGILSEKSLFPVEVKESSGAPQAIFGGRKKVKAQTMAMFYSQLAALLRAGVPMIRSLNVMADQSSNATLNEVISDIRARVEEGESIGDAMARYPKIFNEMGCNMVRAGTEGGFLEDALD
ncbi:MAG: type II secretion system F family protein, partial [Planctomycetaceae bacterium]|nr:type II secretion system F family protein [Planctomycetaceae bacterium]